MQQVPQVSWFMKKLKRLPIGRDDELVSGKREASLRTLNVVKSIIGEAIASLTQSQPSAKGQQSWLLIVNITSFVVLCLVVFSKQVPVVMYRYDGTVLLNAAKNQRQWMGSGFDFTMNFLEGNGGLWWAQINTLLDPAFILSSFLAADDTQVPVFAFTFYATEFFLATMLLGHCVGIRRSVVLGSAWLGSLVAFPFFVPTLGTDLLWGNPHALTVISLLSVTVWLLTQIGRGPRVLSWLSALALLLVGGWICFAFAGAAVQPIPVAMAFVTACVCASRSARELRTKVVALLGVGAILGIVFGRFLIGLYMNTKGAVFPTEMFARPLGLENISHLLAPHGRWMSRLLWFFSLAGALLVVSFSTNRQLRTFAFAFLAIQGGIALLVGLIRFWWGDWWAVNPAYIDIYCFSLTSLLAGGLIAALLRLAVQAARRGWSAPTFRLDECPRTVRNFGAIMLSLLPFISLLWAGQPYRDKNFLSDDPWRWPPQATAVADLLQREIGLQNGSVFRGRAVNLSGSRFLEDLQYVPFVSQHSYDQMVLVYAGNDHRLYGLWYFSIPTLIENNHFSSPFFHLITTRLLNTGKIASTHAQTALTKFDYRVLGALGVRYVVTDTVIASNENSIQRLRFSVFEPVRYQYVYELMKLNVGDYSPTRVHVAADATTAMQLMALPSFDFSKEVVLLDGVGNADWVPALNSQINVFRDHLEVAAESNGRSIIVLPVEYSHCLEFSLRSTGPDPVEVRRGNLEQIAIAFSRSLRGSIALHYGPFRNSGCRLADYRDAEALGLKAVPWRAKE
jgi:hypothetical protein